MKQVLLKLGLLSLLAIVSFANCQTEIKTEPTKDIHPLDRLPANQAGTIVKKAIDYVGGWDKWASKKTFSFYKNIEQLDSTGQLRKVTRQLHQYQLHPQFKARMTWEDKGNQYIIVNNGQQAWKFENGKELTDDKSKNEAWNSSYGSNYVISMPFKLTDSGVILTYDGLDTLNNNKVVHAVKVEYEKGAGSSGGYHTWWYYFDVTTYDLVANYLDYGKGLSYTDYQTFTEVGGIRIHEKRHSYAVDKPNEIGVLKTIYSNAEMQFDVPLAEEIFEPLN